MDNNDNEAQTYIQNLANFELMQESPIDLNIAKTEALALPPLEWHNFEVPPKKIRLTNTGYTMILSAKWYDERPYISGGPLSGNYVFSQIHFHWGRNDMEGSEHSFDGVTYPLEMHVITYKTCYITQESALKEQDGIVVLVYIFKLQTEDNQTLQLLLDPILQIQKPFIPAKLTPFPLSALLRQFSGNYFLYWGSISSSICKHSLLWLLTREPIGVSVEQMESLRVLLNDEDQIILQNFRDRKPNVGSKVFLVNVEGSKHSSLLPIPKTKRTSLQKKQIYSAK